MIGIRILCWIDYSWYVYICIFRTCVDVFCKVLKLLNFVTQLSKYTLGIPKTHLFFVSRLKFWFYIEIIAITPNLYIPRCRLGVGSNWNNEKITKDMSQSSPMKVSITIRPKWMGKKQCIAEAVSLGCTLDNCVTSQ